MNDASQEQSTWTTATATTNGVSWTTRSISTITIKYKYILTQWWEIVIVHSRLQSTRSYPHFTTPLPQTICCSGSNHPQTRVGRLVRQILHKRERDRIVNATHNYPFSFSSRTITTWSVLCRVEIWKSMLLLSSVLLDMAADRRCQVTRFSPELYEQQQQQQQ